MHWLIFSCTVALAISRDGSSGGEIHMCVITKEGVELPKFWEGLEVLGDAKNPR
jgi:20S proteasome subunit beta 1